MIRRNPREEEMYQARLKLWRDEESRLRYAEERALSQGRVESQIDVALKLQRLLRIAESPREALAQLGLNGLGKLIDELLAKLQERKS